MCLFCVVFFFNDTATTEIYTLSLHDALPICGERVPAHGRWRPRHATRDPILESGGRPPRLASPDRHRHIRRDPVLGPPTAPPGLLGARTSDPDLSVSVLVGEALVQPFVLKCDRS